MADKPTTPTRRTIREGYQPTYQKGYTPHASATPPKPPQGGTGAVKPNPEAAKK